MLFFNLWNVWRCHCRAYWWHNVKLKLVKPAVNTPRLAAKEVRSLELAPWKQDLTSGKQNKIPSSPPQISHSSLSLVEAHNEIQFCQSQPLGNVSTPASHFQFRARFCKTTASSSPGPRWPDRLRFSLWMLQIKFPHQSSNHSYQMGLVLNFGSTGNLMVIVSV